MALKDILKTYGDNKLAIALAAATVGALLTKLVPTAWSWLCRGVTLVSYHLGGRLAYRGFLGDYLNWLVIEYKELKLTGVVSSDDSKKPTLEQVFVSLAVATGRVVDSGEGNTALDAQSWNFIQTWLDAGDLLRLHKRAGRNGVSLGELRKARK